jgi:type I restriction enzyme M protein
LATYQFRPNQIERYTRRVSTEELEKNDYNLTISRYVLISVDEKITDLKEVNKSLVDIEKRIKEATEMH